MQRQSGKQSNNRGHRTGRRAVEFGALEPRLLWSATPQGPLAIATQAAPRRTPVVVVPIRVTPKVVTPVPTLRSATALAATAQNGGVRLQWTDHALAATGYRVLRSTDWGDFTVIATLAGRRAAAFSDTSVESGHTYAYQVQAFAGKKISGYSSPASVTLPPPPAPPAANPAAVIMPAAITPGSRASTDVSIATRFGDELVVTLDGAGDSVSLAQSGATLILTADGQAFSEPVPAAGVFVYTRGGADSAISIAASVTVRTTVETIDNAMTSITSAGANVSAWIDSTDAFTGTGDVHRISAFAGGVSKAAGTSLADPSDAGTTATVHLSLWSTGPVAADVNQGNVGDCYFLSSLAAFAGEKPSVLTESAVDMGDGTYVVQFQQHGADTFVRVNADFATGPFAGFEYAHPGASGTIWAMVLEKAFAYFRSGDNTYASIGAGWMSEVYADFGVASANFVPGSYAESAFYTMISTDLAKGDAATLSTSGSSPDLVADHAYTLVSASTDASGVTHYVVRNSWGTSGDALENPQGYATLTFAQLTANFSLGCQATA
ncbi:MAG TPA: C2 family cysteine protease [Tepidisphaeraceae bacterium]|jgi:hypothetical protein